MTEKITKLTEEQEIALAAYRQTWFDYGICTERADRPRAEKAVLRMRELLGIKTVPEIKWFESPKAAAKWIASMTDKTVGSCLSEARWGQQEGAWVAYYTYCRDVLGVVYDKSRSEQLDLWGELVKSCCWWWCYEKAIIFTERPTKVALRLGGRLHAPDGPAVEFSDGYKLYCFEGVRVPETVILHPETLDVKAVLGETNAEVRRVMIAKVGMERLMQDGNAVVLDTQPEENRELLKLPIEGDEDIVVVRVTCPSTGKVYLNRVPPNVISCQQAVAWRFGMKAEDYKPVKES